MPSLLPKHTYDLNYLGRPSYFGGVYSGNTKAVEESLKDPKQLALINTPVYTQGEHTVIFIACYGGANLATVELLLNHGAELRRNDVKGRTPYHYAANSADPKILQYLLTLITANTARNLKDSDDRTLLHAICCYGSSPTDKKRGTDLIESFRILLATCDTTNGLAAGLIYALNQKDKYGFTPLHYAKYYGYTEIFEVVRGLELDLDTVLMPLESDLVIPQDHPAVAIDFFGRTKLHELVFDKKLAESSAELNRLGSYNNPSIPNPLAGYRDVLHYAVCGGTSEIVKLILDDPRTNPMSRDINSITALHFAAHRGDIYIVLALLNNDIIRSQINSRDKFGMTALHALAMNKVADSQKILQLQCFDGLVDAGIDLLALDNSGNTAEQIARIRGNDELANYIKSKQENLDTPDILTYVEERSRGTLLFRPKYAGTRGDDTLPKRAAYLSYTP